MKTFTKKSLSLSVSLLSFLFLLNACSSHEVVSSSGTHLYNENFGLVENSIVDALLQEEILTQSKPTEIELSSSSDPTWTTELVLDADAVTAENYVQAPPVITYKYKYDPKFYDKATWISNNN